MLPLNIIQLVVCELVVLIKKRVWSGTAVETMVNLEVFAQVVFLEPAGPTKLMKTGSIVGITLFKFSLSLYPCHFM